MKTILVAINSKFIHPNLAVRYLKANCDFNVEIKEFTIKDDIDSIYNNIRAEAADLIGFSVYIWNVEMIKSLLIKFSETDPQTKILLGGPEVSYDYEYFFHDYSVDFVIRNEGEWAFRELLSALTKNDSINDIPNLSYIKDNHVISNPVSAISNLDALRNPYFIIDTDYSHRIAYVEMSRGCPFNCSYCLASLEKSVRFFALDRVKSDLKVLYGKGARTFKFLDRTFNVREDLAKSILEFIFTNDFSDAVFQFEINADILLNDFISYINDNCPPEKIRFEIGIQSISDRVNLAVHRRQDTARLMENIKLLQKGNAILHLDLIAGLPYETLQSFIETFDTVFKLYGQELQLGFLKMLKGTALASEKVNYGYQISPVAPYELISNDSMSADDLELIHHVEDMLNIFWNKSFMKRSMMLITAEIDSPFSFFLNLYRYFNEAGLDAHRYQLYEICLLLEKFVDKEVYRDEIRLDYLKHHRVKPKIYWEKSSKKNDSIRRYHSFHPETNIDDLYKYGVVIDYHDAKLIYIYYPDKAQYHLFDND